MPSQPLLQRLGSLLAGYNYNPHWESSKQSFLEWVGHNRHRVDCLLLESVDDFSDVIDHLQKHNILLPTVVLVAGGDAISPGENELASTNGTATVDPACDLAISYHAAIACVPYNLLKELHRYIEQAIEQFLQLPHQKQENHPPAPDDTRHFLLSLQQQRLTEKLRERLGYLGVYYKRSPQNFLRNLNPSERTEVLDKLRADYRAIILNYFSDQGNLNQIIDDFVNVAFFADASISQVVEIHMELMDDFAKQLKLEGRNEEILLDYRLTLIDVIAHLCEMYRRSIPREG